VDDEEVLFCVIQIQSSLEHKTLVHSCGTILWTVLCKNMYLYKFSTLNSSRLGNLTVVWSVCSSDVACEPPSSASLYSNCRGQHPSSDANGCVLLAEVLCLVGYNAM
jgi:hypothetical protein